MNDGNYITVITIGLSFQISSSAKVTQISIPDYADEQNEQLLALKLETAGNKMSLCIDRLVIRISILNVL